MKHSSAYWLSLLAVYGINLLSKLTPCVWTKPRGFLLSQRIFPICLLRCAIGTPIPVFCYPWQLALHWCRSWVWAWGSHLTVRADMTFMNFSEDSLAMRVFWGVECPSEGVVRERFCPGSSGGRWMFFSEGQSGNTPALLPKPYYKLGGFRVGRRGGLRRRFELEIGGCYTWCSPCLPVLGAFGRQCH